MSQLSSRFTLSNALLRLLSSYAAADAFCAAPAKASPVSGPTITHCTAVNPGQRRVIHFDTPKTSRSIESLSNSTDWVVRRSPCPFLCLRTFSSHR
jgi:hypothetical protein